MQTPYTALVTGANAGIGLELTKQLLADGWQIIALIRSNFPADETVQRAIEQKQVRVYHADLSESVSLRKALTAIKANERAVDVLFNNAGVLLGELSLSPQGREMHYEVNTVVPYVILMELKPLLLAGSLKRVINTSSNALLRVNAFIPGQLSNPPTFQKLFGPYAQSKVALSLWTEAIAPDLLAQGIRIYSVCPGPNKTSMTGGEGMPGWLLPIRHLFFAHPGKGAARLYELLANDQHAVGSFVDGGRVKKLPFSQHAAQVLKQVETAYAETYTAPTTL